MSIDNIDYMLNGREREYKYVELFESIKQSDEKILWTARPSLLAYLASGGSQVFGYLLFFAFAYFIFGNVFRGIGFGGSSSGFGPFSFIFFIWIVVALFSIGRYFTAYPNTYYAATDKRLIHRTGILGTDYKSLPYKSIQDMNVNVNPLEMLLGKGTICIHSGEMGNKGRKIYENLTGIHDPYTVFSNLTKFADDTSDLKNGTTDSSARSASKNSWKRRDSLDGGPYDSISGILSVVANLCYLAAFALVLWIGWTSMDTLGLFNGERSLDDPELFVLLIGEVAAHPRFRYLILAGVLSVVINVISNIVESIGSIRS